MCLFLNTQLNSRISFLLVESKVCKNSVKILGYIILLENPPQSIIFTSIMKLVLDFIQLWIYFKQEKHLQTCIYR